MASSFGNDGSTWDVKTDSVALADHVGHTITVKGTVSNVTMHNSKEEAKDAAASAGVRKPTMSTATWKLRRSKW